MWSATTLAPSFSALEADVAAQLAPVRGMERSQLRADWHRYAVSWIIAALSSRRSVPATRGPARGRSGEGMGAHASAAFPRGRRNGSGTARNTPSPREGARGGHRNRCSANNAKVERNGIKLVEKANARYLPTSGPSEFPSWVASGRCQRRYGRANSAHQAHQRHFGPLPRRVET